MKTLLILRHAKSSWKDSSIDDHDRTLNPRGRRDAPRIGLLLRNEDLLPELILTSTAQRARETTEAVIESSGFQGELRFWQGFYLAEPTTWIEALSSLPHDFNRVMIVGHNPGLELLLEQLTGCDEPFPTAALAQVQLSIEDWGDLSRQPKARLMGLWRPKELAR